MSFVINKLFELAIFIAWIVVTRMVVKIIGHVAKQLKKQFNTLKTVKA
jgi:hypothetical protein